MRIHHMKTFNKAVVSLACLLMLAVGSTAHAEDRHVWLINDTPDTIMRVYASNSPGGEWREDILGSEVLEAGNSVVVNIDDGTDTCYFNLQAIYNDDTWLAINEFNVCTDKRLTIRDDEDYDE